MQIDIEKLADEFFEWDGPRTPVVTFVSAKLFAAHVARLALEEAAKACDDYAFAPEVRDRCGDVVHPATLCRDAIRTLSRQITEGK